MRRPLIIRHPVIVIEGADCCGKTTLADAVIRHSGAKYVHMTYRFKRTPREFLNYQWAALRLCARLAQDNPVVLDRWWMSDEVYGDEFRGGSTNPGAWVGLSRVGRQLGFSNVIAVPSDRAAHARRHSARAAQGLEMYTTQGRLCDRYDEWARKMWYMPDYFIYDMDRFEMDAVDGLAVRLYQWACDGQATAWCKTADDLMMRPDTWRGHV